MSLTADELENSAVSLRVSFWSVSPVCSRGRRRYLLARATFPGKTLFDAVVHLPLVLPR